MSDDKKKKEGEERGFSGSKTPRDPEFVAWIQRQWSRGEKLEKIDVVEFFSRGPNKGTGHVVDFEMFGGRAPDAEEAIDLSHRFLGSAQVNCDRVHKKEMSYYVRAFDRGRSTVGPQGGGDPVSTFPLFLQPGLYIKKQGAIGSDDEEGELTSQRVALSYLQTGIQAYQADRVREDGNIGDLIAMFLTERREQRLWEIELQKMNRSIMMDWVQAVREREAALSTELDRLPARELAKIKAEMLRDGFKTGKNLLTGIIGNMSESRQEAASSPQQGNAGGPPGEAIVVTRMTQERMLIDNFVEDCKNAKIDTALFGEVERDEQGKVKIIKEGIFKPEQIEILFKVLTGRLHADALDDLLPDSGKETAISMDQLRRAQGLDGMTDGIAISLAQLVSIRNEKRAAKAATQSPPNGNGENDV